LATLCYQRLISYTLTMTHLAGLVSLLTDPQHVVILLPRVLVQLHLGLKVLDGRQVDELLASGILGVLGTAKEDLTN